MRVQLRILQDERDELEQSLKKPKQGTFVQDYVQSLKDKAKFKLIAL